MQLVLSTFTGIGLLDKAFSEAGFCVVSAGDIITGHDIRDFTGLKNKFNGIIGGSPCQDYSKANRNRPALADSYGYEMLLEYVRVVEECQPDWYLLENVPGVPTISIDGYENQRIDINQSWYSNVNRLRHIQFGHKRGHTLQIPRGVTDRSQELLGCALASDSRTFKELKALQGLPDDFDLPSFNVKGKKFAVGNGVPRVMGDVLANAVKAVTRLDDNCDLVAQQNVTHPGQTTIHSYFSDNDVMHQEEICDLVVQQNVTDQNQKCLCGCGRFVTGRHKYYDYSCRKRAQRNRDKLNTRIINA